MIRQVAVAGCLRRIMSSQHPLTWCIQSASIALGTMYRAPNVVSGKVTVKHEHVDVTGCDVQLCEIHLSRLCDELTKAHV